MNTSWFYMLHEQKIRDRELAERLAKRKALAELRSSSPSLRAQMARRLFALAVAAEREETWRLIWEKLEARGRL